MPLVIRVRTYNKHSKQGGSDEYSEEQIIGILKEAEAGTKLTDLCRKYGISEQTYYNWKAKYSGMTVSDTKRLRQLEDENRRLKHIVADLNQKP